MPSPRIACLTAAALLVAAAPARADGPPATLSIWGYSGLVQMPTAAVHGFRDFSVGAQVMSKMPGFTAVPFVTAGVFDGLEATVLYGVPLAGFSGLTGSAKYQLIRPTKERPTAVAVGMNLIGVGGPDRFAEGNDLYIVQSKYHEQFAADSPADVAAAMSVTQRPILEAALNEASGAPAWRDIPSWFLFGSADKNIPAESHRFMAERAGSRHTVELAGGSHEAPGDRRPRWMVAHREAVRRARTEPGLQASSSAPEPLPSDSAQLAQGHVDPQVRAARPGGYAGGSRGERSLPTRPAIRSPLPTTLGLSRAARR